MKKLIVSFLLITALCHAADQFKGLESHEILYYGKTDGSNCITFTTHWHGDDLEANYFHAGPLKGQYRAKRVCFSGLGFNSLDVGLESAQLLFHKLQAVHLQQPEAKRRALILSQEPEKQK